MKYCEAIEGLTKNPCRIYMCSFRGMRVYLHSSKSGIFHMEFEWFPSFPPETWEFLVKPANDSTPEDQDWELISMSCK